MTPPIRKLHRTLLALTVPLLFAACAEQEAPELKEVVRPVRAIKVADSGQFQGRSFPGRAKASQEVELSFRVAGPLIARPVNVGDLVKQGDEVARIDPRDFEVEVRNVEGQLERAKAALTRATADLARLENIYKKDPGATSKTAIDRARHNRDGGRADVKSLGASLAAASDQLAYTRLKAPFDGIVVSTYVENFEHVRAKQAIVRILDDSSIEFEVSIPESMISLASQVTNVQVEFDAFPGTKVPATVKEIGTEASSSTRTYPVTLVMAQPEAFKILPGMAGKATGDPPAVMTKGALEVPISATFSAEEADKTYLWVIDETSSTVKRRDVEVGELTDRGIQIRTGLEAGEWVATAGVHYLREGQKIRILAQ